VRLSFDNVIKCGLLVVGKHGKEGSDVNVNPAGMAVCFLCFVLCLFFFSLSYRKGKGLDTCCSTAYMSQT